MRDLLTLRFPESADAELVRRTLLAAIEAFASLEGARVDVLDALDAAVDQLVRAVGDAGGRAGCVRTAEGHDGRLHVVVEHDGERPLDRSLPDVERCFMHPFEREGVWTAALRFDT